MSGGRGYYESFQTVGNECTNALEKTMLYQHKSPEGTSQAFRRAFAATLTDTLGQEGALQICRDNGRGGIFDILLDEPKTRWN